MNKKYSDNDLINIQVKCIEECEKIMEMIIKRENYEEIKMRYKNLKKDVKNEANRINLVVNRKSASEFVSNYYRPSISEAAAFGLVVSTNSNVCTDMYNAVQEAHYKLTKYISLEELKKIYMQV